MKIFVYSANQLDLLRNVRYHHDIRNPCCFDLALSTVEGGGGGMHGRRTALRYSPSTPSPAGAR
eukprot:COSAG01_NODE_46061_length_403_cov_1.937500_1_plen_63_part_10